MPRLSYDEYAEIVRVSRVEVITVDRVEPCGPGDLVIFRSKYPNADVTVRVAYVRDGHKLWNMIVE